MIIHFLMLISVAILLSDVSARKSDQSVPKPRRCQDDDSWFTEKKEYRYTYTGVVQSGITGTSPKRSGYMFTCVVSIISPRKCENILKVKKCNLRQRAPNPKDEDNPFEEITESKEFSSKMSKNKVYFQMQGGLVDPDTVVMQNEEILDVVNLKRGMLSALQLQKLTKESYDSPQYLSDVYGTCPTKFERLSDKTIIHSSRDLTSCSYPEVFKRQFRFYSMIKELTGGAMTKNYTEVIYPFESAIDCDYKLEGSKLAMVKCFHHQAMIPFTFNGTIKAGAMTNISQVMELDEVTDHRSKKIDRSLKNRYVTGLKYTFDEELDSVVSADDIFKQLKNMAQTLIEESISQIPGEFQELVGLLRRASQETVENAYDLVKNCPATKCHKKSKGVMDKFITDGFMSCGTSACITVMAKHIADTQIDSIAVTAFLLDLTLNFNSAIDGTVNNVLEICKTKKTGTCLLLLSGMVRTYASKLDKLELEEEDGAVYKTVKYIRDQLGENCKAGVYMNSANGENKGEQLTQFLTAIKSLGNIGHYIQDSFDKSVEGTRQVVPTLLSCANNEELPELVAKSALLALQKMNLDDETIRSLFAITEDQKRTVVIRTTAFSILARDEKRATLKNTLQLIKEEKNVHVRTYMLSTVVNIMESQDPRFRTLQSMWRELLVDLKERLPELDLYLYRKSRYAELSRTFIIPLLQRELGITLELNVLYEPISFLPRSFSFNLTVNRMGHVYHVMEMGLDVAGFDTLAEMIVLGKKGGDGIKVMDMLKFIMSGADLEKIKATMKQIAAAKKAAAAAAAQGGAGGLPPGFKLPPDGKLPPGFKLPPGVKLPPGYSIPGGAAPLGGAQGAPQGAPSIPPAMAAFMELLKKPNVSYIPEDMQTRFQQIFDDVNYPAFTMPSGHIYVKLLGSEIAFTTLEAMIGKIRSIASERGIANLVNLQKLMEKLAKGDDFVAGTFSKDHDVQKKIPTMLGVPMSLEVSGTRGLLIDGNVKANLRGIMVKGEPVTGNATIRVRGSRLFSGVISVPFPTLSYEVGLKMSLTASLNLGARGGLAFAQSQRELTLFRHNIDEPKELFAVDGNLVLLHMNETEVIPRDEMYKTEVEKCSSERLQALTGRSLCWRATYQNASGSDSHPYFPLTGSVSGRLVLTPVDEELTMYSLVCKLNYLREPVEGDSDPEAFHIIRHTTMTYSAPGKTLQRLIEAEFKRNLNTTELNGHLKVPEPFDSLVTIVSKNIRKPMPAAQPAPQAAPAGEAEAPPPIKQLSIKWTRAGNTMYEFSIKRQVKTEFEKLAGPGSGLKVLSPITHLDSEIVLAIPKVTLAINLTHSSSVGGRDMKTDLQIKYFCSRHQSLFYLLHPNPKAAMANNHISDITVHNEAGIETVGERDWKAVDKFNMVYTGQNFSMSGVMWTKSNRKHVYRETEATWLNKKGKQEKLIMNAHAENKSDNFQMKFHFDSKINRVNKYELDLEGNVKGVLADLKGDMTIDYKKKDKDPKKRSVTGLADTFKKYEDKLETAASYLKSVFDATAETEESAMVGDDPIVSFMDRDEWKVTTTFNLNREPFESAPGSTQFGLNMTYPRAGTYHDIKLRVRHYRGMDPLMGGFRFLIGAGFDSTFMDRQVDARLNLFRSPVKTVFSDGLLIKKLKDGEVTRNYNVTLVYQPGTEFKYYRSFMSPPLNSSLDINYVYSKESKKSYLDIQSDASSVIKMLNHQYSRSSIMEPTKLTSQVNLTSALGHLTGNSQLEWSLPNNGISYSSKYDLEPRIPTGVAGEAELKFKYNNNTLPNFKMTIKRSDIVKKSILSIKLTSATEGVAKLLTQKEKDNKPVQDIEWKMAITSHDRIRNDVNWRPEIGHMIVGRVRSMLNQSVIMATNNLAVTLTNFKRNFTDRIVPVVNKTWGELSETYIKPHWTKVVTTLNEIQIPNSEKSMGDIAMLVLKRLKEYPLELRQRFYNLLPGHLLQHSGLKDRILYLMTERIPLYLKAWQIRRPPLTRAIFARKIKPLIEKRLREAKTSFSISHPLIWEKFMSIPRTTHTTRAVVSWLWKNVPRFVRGQFSWKSYPFNAAISGKNFVHTFDGHIYRKTEPQRDSCTYLMAADFKSGTFALLYSGSSITYFSASTTLSINDRCKVTVNQASSTSELPWMTEDGQISVMVHGSEVNMIIKNHGIKIKCDTLTRSTNVDLVGAHYNHSLGLLGTGDREPSTDFRLPNGEVTDNINKFLNAYELTGKSACQNDVPAVSQLPACKEPSKKCSEFFSLASSPLKDCFPYIKPTGFKDVCETTTASCDNEEDPEQVACDLSNVYVDDCRSRRIKVHKPCVFCGKKAVGSTWSEDIQHKTADVVFVISRNQGMLDDKDMVVDYVMNLAKKLKYQAVQFGLVTYGSAKFRSQALTHTIGGELFGKEDDLKTALESLTFDTDSHYPAFNALEMALQFKFRPNSHRIVFLLTEWNHQASLPNPLTSAMLELLQKNSITVNVISMFEPLSGRVLALGHDGQATMLNGKSQKIPLPMDDYGKLVEASKGSVFYLEKLKSAGNKLLRNFHKYIVEQMTATNAGKCRECTCSVSRTGDGDTLCQTVPC